MGFLFIILGVNVSHYLVSPLYFLTAMTNQRDRGKRSEWD